MVHGARPAHGRRSKAISPEVNRLCRRVRPIAVTARRRVRRTARDAARRPTWSDEAAPRRAPWADDPPWATRLRLVGRAPAASAASAGGWPWAATCACCTPRAAEIGILPAGCRGARRPVRRRRRAARAAAGAGRRRTSPPTSPRRCSTGPSPPPGGAVSPTRWCRGWPTSAALPLEDGSVDLVVTFTGLHCFPDAAAGGRGDGAGAAARRRGHRQHAGAPTRGCATSRVRRAGRRARLLGPMCSRAEVVAWFADGGRPGPAGHDERRHRLLPGSEAMSRFPPGVPTDRLGARRASPSVRGVVLPGRGYPPAAPGLAYAGYVLRAAGWRVRDVWWDPPANASLSIDGEVAWVGEQLASATVGCRPARCSWSASRSARTAPGSPPSAPTRRSG